MYYVNKVTMLLHADPMYPNSLDKVYLNLPPYLYNTKVLGKDNVLDVSIDDKCPEVSLQLVNECGASETVQLQYRG